MCCLDWRGGFVLMRDASGGDVRCYVLFLRPGISSITLGDEKLSFFSFISAFLSLCVRLSWIKCWQISACRRVTVISNHQQKMNWLCCVCHAAAQRERERVRERARESEGESPDGWMLMAADVSGMKDWCTQWKGVCRCVWCNRRQLCSTDRRVEDFLGATLLQLQPACALALVFTRLSEEGFW